MESLNALTEETEEQGAPAVEIGSNRNADAAQAINVDALTEQILKRLNSQLLLRNLAGLGLNQQNNDDSSQDLDLEFNERRIGKEKGWRSTLEKDPDKVIKHVIKHRSRNRLTKI